MALSAHAASRRPIAGLALGLWFSGCGLLLDTELPHGEIDGGPTDRPIYDGGSSSDARLMDAGLMDASVADSGVVDADVDAGLRPLTLFVTSERLPATLGGLAGADGHCQRLARAAEFEGNFRAVLSDATVDARTRITRSGPIYNLMGELVASDPADLWDGSLMHAVVYDENRDLAHTVVWTGTDSDGTKDRDTGTTFCSNWTVARGTVEAGRTSTTTAAWISIYGSGPNANSCANDLNLYCIGPLL